MKQILLVGAGQHFPKGAFKFLDTMHDEGRVHAKGLFFRPVDYSVLAAQKALFSQLCKDHHIPYSLHDNDRGWDKNLLQKESRFADLILISPELFGADTDIGNSNRCLREALHATECPVLLIPEDFTTVQHLFMAYDGSPDSLYALKQFCYLFPDLIDLPTEILYIDEGVDDSIPDVDSLKQFTRAKFNCMGFSKLHFNPKDYLATWLSEKKHALLVSGSFGRSSDSYIVNRSFSEEIIHGHILPIFIAHR